MSADHSEARERARQEFEQHIVYEKYLGIAVTIAKDDLGQYTDSLIHEQWIDWLEAFERGRRSLEQERDELRTSLTELLQFCFVKREGGQWCFKTHNGIPMGMGRKQEQIVKQAVVHKGDS